MKYDVCIVGAGVAGALAAYKLASAGKTVVLLDAGPRFDLNEEERYERVKRDEGPWNWENSARDYYEDAATPRIWLNDNRVKGVGGTTLKWNARAERLKPGDFKMQSAFGTAVDWPMSYDDLEPWYFEAEKELGVAGKESTLAPERNAPFPLPHHPISFAEKEFVLPAFDKLGLSIGYDSLAINSQDYDSRPRCDAYSTCIPMCPIHAKYTAMTHVLKAEATGRVNVKSNAPVRRVKLNSKSKVKSVHYIDEEGNYNEQKANVFILAAGGVEIPRLLLLSSADNAHQNGLANSSGQVGKNYMTHPRMHIRGTLPEKIGPHRVGFSTTCSWALYNHETLPEIGNVLLKPDINGGPGPATLATNSDLHGKELFKKIRNDYGHQMGIHILGEMLPQEQNRVFLSESRVDCFGDPVPRIEMQLSDFDKKTLYKGAEISRNLLKQMNGTNLWDNGIDAVKNHIIGTTRMGSNHQNSVCDKWGRCHDLDNLYIAGSSLFPTSGCAAPTLTIGALALRTAAYIADNY